jgi:hypothetical protein
MVGGDYEDEDISEEDIDVRDDVLAYGLLDEASGEIGFTLFAELDEDSNGLGNVWFESMPDTGYKTNESIVNFLSDLGAKKPTILVDWEQCLLMSLTDREALEEYFDEMSLPAD